MPVPLPDGQSVRRITPEERALNEEATVIEINLGSLWRLLRGRRE